jgi:hypothetical protein
MALMNWNIPIYWVLDTIACFEDVPVGNQLHTNARLILGWAVDAHRTARLHVHPVPLQPALLLVLVQFSPYHCASHRSGVHLGERPVNMP